MLSKYTSKALVVIDPQVKDKEELFEKTVNHLYNLDYVLNKKNFLQALKAREEAGNTELMPGVALPHAKSDSVEKLFLCIIILQEGIDFHNSEMGKAKIIFFFGTSNQYNKEYLQLLARSARLLKIEEFRKQLLESTEAEQIMQVLEKFDLQENQITESKKQFMMLITLHIEHKLDDLLTTLIELGVTNATVMESMSLKSRISLEIPLFSGMSYPGGKKPKESIVVISTIKDEMTAYRLVELLKENNLDMNKKGVGNIQIIEAPLLLGNPDEEIDL